MEKKPESNIDIHLVAALSTVSFFCVITLPEGSALRAVLALPLILLFPGYLLAVAIFFNKKTDFLFRIILGVVLSVVVFSLIALGLGFTADTIGIRTAPAALLIYMCTLIFYLASITARISARNAIIFHLLHNRKRKPEERRLADRVFEEKTVLQSLSPARSDIKMDMAFLTILVIAIIVAGYCFYVASQPQVRTWTDIYLYGPDPKNPFIIKGNGSVNSNYSVHVQVVNHERRAADYTIIGNLTVGVPGYQTYNSTEVFRSSANMEDGQSIEWTVPFKFVKTGTNTLGFFLYMDGKYCREVHAVIKVI